MPKSGGNEGRGSQGSSGLRVRGKEDFSMSAHEEIAIESIEAEM